MRRTLVIAAALLTVSLGAPMGAHATAAPQRVTPPGPSTVDDLVIPLAGSAQTLVFTRQVRLSGDSNEANTGLGIDQAGGIATVYARGPSGEDVSLGAMPAGVTTQIGEWSTAAEWVAAGDYGYTYPVTRTAYLWNTRTGARRTVTFARGDTYLTVSRLGLVYLTPSGEIKIRRFDDTTLALGHPFGRPAKDALAIAAAGPSGIAVTIDDQLKYIALALPHTVITLDNPAFGPIICQQVGTTYAACSYVDGDGGYIRPEDPVLLPLNGGSATLPARTYDDDDDALLGTNTLVWWDDGVVYTQAAGSTTATTTTLGGRPFALTGAFGDAFVDAADADSLKRLTPSDAVSSGVPARRSPSTVDNFALTPHRIVYSDDQPVSSRVGDIESVFSRGLRPRGHRVAEGSPTLLSTGTATVTGNLVAASDSVAVYATDKLPVVGEIPAALRIVTASGITTIPDVVGYGLIQVWRHDVLYQHLGDDGPTPVKVYDAATGRTRTVLSPHGIDNDSIALWGHYVTYATAHGSIVRENFLTGKKTVLAPALSHDSGGVTVTVYAHGHWVGWTAQPLQLELGHAINDLRNVAPGSRTIKLPHTLYELTGAGAVLASHHVTAHNEEGAAADLTDGVPLPSITTWLRHYSGRTVRLLSSRQYVAGPQVVDGMLAWAGRDGVLRIRRL